jgi:hypothetical protein
MDRASGSVSETWPSGDAVNSPASAQEVVAKIQDIDLHHPDWSEIVLVGVEPTTQLTSELEAERLAIIPTSGVLSIRR